MLGIDEIKALLKEMKGMRHDLVTHLDALTKEVHRVNENLEEIEKQNRERFAHRQAALKAELSAPASRHRR